MLIWKRTIPWFCSVVLAAGIAGCTADQSPRGEPQSLEDLVQRNLAARGGGSRLAELHTIVLRGAYYDSGESGDGTPFAEYYRFPWYLAEAELFGRRILQGYDGNLAWWLAPPFGIRTAEAIPTEDTRSFAIPYNADFVGRFAAPGRAGFTITFSGRQTVAGRSIYRVDVQQEDGLRVCHLFDAVTFLETERILIRTAKGSSGAGESQATDTASLRFFDYRKHDGLNVARRVEYRNNGTLMGTFHIDDVALNVPLEPDFFRMPDPRSARAPNAR